METEVHGQVARTKWAQNKTHLFVTFEIHDAIGETSQIVGGNKIVFKSGQKGKNTQYQVELELFASVKEDELKIVKNGREVLVMPEKVEAVFWPRLTDSTEKLPFLHIDFDKWIEEDEEENDRMDYMNGDYPELDEGMNMDDGMDHDSFNKLNDEEDDEDDEDDGEAAEDIIEPLKEETSPDN